VRRNLHLTVAVTACVIWLAGLALSVHAADPAADELQIEVTKKGLGKEVVMRRGPKEWYMLVEVTPENTVVIRQEKENEAYLLDDSETHDRSMTPAEVDTAINDFINSVKTQQKKKTP
jgi:hypothetical protein